jgi:predicted ArsR family transcriptional regulator
VAGEAMTPSTTRDAVLAAIEHAAAPTGVADLAAQLGLHPNAIRKHLARLRHDGLVVEATQHRPGGGRPRLVYRLDPAAPRPGWNPYEVLAPLLVEVALGRSPRDVGADFGARLADSAPDAGVVDVLVAIAHRHGFAPTVVDRTADREDDADVVVELGRCPFAAAVSDDRLVCQIHLGIAEGIAARTGDGRAVARLEIAAPDLGRCRFHLRNDRCTPLAHDASTRMTKEHR